MKTTGTMYLALTWLHDHGGDGVIDKYGRIVAQGEVAKFDSSTWLRLVAAGHLRSLASGRLSITSFTLQGLRENHETQ